MERRFTDCHTLPPNSRRLEVIRVRQELAAYAPGLEYQLIQSQLRCPRQEHQPIHLLRSLDVAIDTTLRHLLRSIPPPRTKRRPLRHPSYTLTKISTWPRALRQASKPNRQLRHTTTLRTINYTDQ